MNMKDQGVLSYLTKVTVWNSSMLQIIWNLLYGRILPCGRFVFSVYLFNPLFISVWAHRDLFYTLVITPNINFFAEIILAFATGYYFIWFLCPIDISLSLCFYSLFLNYIFYWTLNFGLGLFPPSTFMMLLSCLLPSTIFTINPNFASLNVRSFFLFVSLCLGYQQFCNNDHMYVFNPVADLRNFLKVWSLMAFINFGKHLAVISPDSSSVLFSLFFLLGLYITPFYIVLLISGVLSFHSFFLFVIPFG